ncbi:unnamed protein product, partial [Brachionus calyciflorus]
MENILIKQTHPNIKFTIEHECNKTLPFLDTLVNRSLGKFTTTIYHKKTFTGVYLNWTSLTARKYKIGLLSCLLNRIEAICSEENDIISEEQKLKTIFLKNQYPQDIIEEEFKRFENKKPKQLENIEGSIETEKISRKQFPIGEFQCCSCCQHESSTGNTMDYDNIEIIAKADTDMKLRIKELLHILK